VDDGDVDVAERESSPGGPRPTEGSKGSSSSSTATTTTTTTGSSSSSSSSGVEGGGLRRADGFNADSVLGRWPTVGSILEPMLELNTVEGDAAWEALSLTQRQWSRVCEYEEKNQLKDKSLWRRMVNVNGAARTIIGSYRQGYLRQSQFVWPPDSSGSGSIGSSGSGSGSGIDGGGSGRDGGCSSSICSDGGSAAAVNEAQQVPAVEASAALPAKAAATALASTAAPAQTPTPTPALAPTSAPAPASAPTAPLRPRFFSPRECCRMQGFPESFIIPAACEGGGRDKGSLRLYHMIGNAVCPPVVQSIAVEMLKAGLLAKEDR